MCSFPDVPAAGWVKNLIESQHSRSDSLSAAVSGSRTSPDGEHVPQFAVANKLSDDGKVNRMELAEALMEEYLSAKQIWEVERDSMIKNARANNENMEDITRKLAHITAIREAQLAAKHADAIVRGYSHTIRQYLGYMDIKSSSELLQDAKDALREAACSSLDGAMKIYPVQMMPIDWFQSLSTSFTMEDLTSNSDAIYQQIDAKSKHLDVLQARLAALQLSPKNDLKELKLAAELAQSEYSKSQSNLEKAYTSNVISLAKAAVSVSGVFMLPELQRTADIFGIAPSAFVGIEEAMKKSTAAQVAVNSASRAYSQALSAVTLAAATDTSQETTSITLQIDAVRREIAELTTRVRVLGPSPAVPGNIPKLEELSFFPPPPSGTAGGGRWQEITLTHETSNIRQASMTQVGSSVSGSDVSIFWGSKKQTTSSAEDSASSNSESLKVDIGFRATMVTVDRGGWFQPQFFKQSSGFCHIDKKIFASKWPEGINSMEDLRNAQPTQWEALNKGLFPAYPVGFIICKDITIKVNMSAQQVSNRSKEFEEYVQSSNGIFCWSNSSSSHAQSSSRSSQTITASDGVVIRIPGPQILGYMLQYVENDLTKDLNPDLPTDFLLSDADYEAGFNKIDNAPKASEAAHALAPPANSSTNTLVAAATADTPPSSVSPPKKDPVHASGYYAAPKQRV
ncbi:hypothetical protein K443DRAFT_15285 [Laccaria amethystina LaAM-08-1]|uniref:Uncharacterized protein n=1 Tax=Laccaria amethystina LaAM-08-1 TaxID=1095629 RepID=A0A0C9WLE0_9AGAR|nr:hypothetical protein K443DRAFT_15421 [Laccaria amethystina LaAM-08-1]KIJ90384.1 hypothetical protein K443DRAFT_15285 [Laccaria amethystina LaAM-08-1]